MRENIIYRKRNRWYLWIKKIKRREYYSLPTRNKNNHRYHIEPHTFGSNTKLGACLSPPFSPLSPPNLCSPFAPSSFSSRPSYLSAPCRLIHSLFLSFLVPASSSFSSPCLFFFLLSLPLILAPLPASSFLLSSSFPWPLLIRARFFPPSIAVPFPLFKFFYAIFVHSVFLSHSSLY